MRILNSTTLISLLLWEAKRLSIEEVMSYIRSQSLKGSIGIDDYLYLIRMLSNKAAKYRLKLNKLLKLMA